MPAISQVIHGSQTFTSSSGTSIAVTLPGSASVTVADSIVMFTARSNDTTTAGRDLRHLFSVYISSSTQITFTRNTAGFAGDVVVEYYVVEYDSGAGVTIQTGSQNCTATPTDITISTIDTAAAYPMAFFNTNIVGIELSSVGGVPSFTSTTNLRFTFLGTPSSGQYDVRWQVVEFDPADAAVQSGVTTITSAYAGSATLSPSVDLGKTLIAGWGNSNATGQRANARIWPTSSSQIDFQTQAYGSAITWTASWFAIEMLDGSTVEAGTGTIANAATSPSTAPSWSTAMTNGAVFSVKQGPNAYINASNDSAAPDSVFFSVSLDSPQDSLTVTRTGSTNALEFYWQAIEWAASGGGGGSTVALSGQSVSFSAGTLTPLTEYSFTLSGQSGTFSGGTLTPSNDVELALSGQSASFASGTLSGLVEYSIALSGSSASFSLGTLTPDTGVVIALSGQSSTFSVGTLYSNLEVPLIGISSTFSLGTITPASGTFVTLSGVSSTFSAGSFGQSFAYTLSGNSSTFSYGSLGVVAPTQDQIHKVTFTYVSNTSTKTLKKYKMTFSLKKATESYNG